MISWRAALCLVAIGLVWDQQAAAPVLRVVEPTAETILAGQVMFRAEVTGAKVRQVEFQVNGEMACRATPPRLECSWDAGTSVASRDVRVVATLEDGRRLTTALRTRGISVANSVQVEYVLVTALVTDNRGQFVPGLTADDFRVLDEGVLQTPMLLDSGQDGADVLISLDQSGSMFGDVAELREIASDFMQRLRPVDTVTLAGFNSFFNVLADRKADKAARSLALANLDPYGGTALYDAIISGAKVVSTHTGRRAMVVFTDGDDLSSRSTPESARAALHAEDVVLYLVATGKADSDPALRRALSTLAEETGGAAYFDGRLRNTARYFREIVDDLAKQYLFAFSPGSAAADGKWHKLTVEPKNRAHRVRARAGYFASKGG